MESLAGYDSLMQVIGYPCVSHRLQAWDFSAQQIPDMTDERRNLVCSRCKVHNDATVDISQDGRRLAAIVPESHPSMAVCVYSLEAGQLGRLLSRVSLSSNTISVSLSPRGRHLVVGLPARRAVTLPAETQLMAQIYRLDDSSDQLALIKDLQFNSGEMLSRNVSINCIRWLPTPGAGLVYGTNRGKLVMLK
ncbi:activating molecule in BECN1-regulated autophagy protein 1-like [Pollicipes pollicipes]|uniref:activating molecule in BECN1-regulated autophagy protein 1-like n=1 Tax=Pollicipes pollicipes TaxID=41117 RepID=UPI0018850E7A|nr:activating molecule in BECN1-regulated autophagy protein 1-like [Pollicipes pollicipes]